MIRILNILSDTNIGGAGRAVLNYLEFMDRSRFEAAAVVPRGSMLIKPLRDLHVEVLEIDAMEDKSMDLKALKPLKAAIREVRPDIVHTHGSLSGRLAGAQCKKPVVFTRHSAFPFPDKVTKTPLKLVYRFMYTHWADRIIVISPAGAELLTQLGVPEGKLEIMMNGVKPLTRRSVEERAAYRRELGIRPEDMVAVMVARIEEYKGHLDVLDAMNTLRGQGVKLVVAGTGSFESAVRKRAAELGLEEDVIFTGFLSDVLPVMSIADVQVNASYLSETSSLSLIEGMSIGVPAVASDCCGNPWLVNNGVSGLLFPPRDSGALAGILERLARDRGEIERLGLGARQAYLAGFTGEKYAGRIEEIYLKILEERNEKGK